MTDWTDLSTNLKYEIIDAGPIYGKCKYSGCGFWGEYSGYCESHYDDFNVPPDDCYPDDYYNEGDDDDEDC